jgi:tRNA G10  N-methylase Trm11
LLLADVIGQDIDEKRTAQVKHNANYYPKTVVIVYIIIFRRLEKVIEKEENINKY